MKTAELALLIARELEAMNVANVTGNVLPEEVHPVEGTVKPVDPANFPTVYVDTEASFVRTPPAQVIEQWLNHVFLPAMSTGRVGGFRDHTGGGGYGIDVRPGSRIRIEVRNGRKVVTAQE